MGDFPDSNLYWNKHMLPFSHHSWAMFPSHTDDCNSASHMIGWMSYMVSGCPRSCAKFFQANRLLDDCHLPHWCTQQLPKKVPKTPQVNSKSVLFMWQTMAAQSEPNTLTKTYMWCLHPLKQTPNNTKHESSPLSPLFICHLLVSLLKMDTILGWFVVDSPCWEETSFESNRPITRVNTNNDNTAKIQLTDGKRCDN